MSIAVRTTLPDGSLEQWHEATCDEYIRAINEAELLRPGAVAAEVRISMLVIGRCSKCNVPLFDNDKTRERGGKTLCHDCR